MSNQKKELVNSRIDRQNILNNSYALFEIEKATGIQGISFEEKIIVLKEQVALFFEVDIRTIENYIAKNHEELIQNGYEVLRGKRLSDLKLSIFASNVTEIDFGNIKMAPQLAIFDFKAFLNIGMLLIESEKARVLRKLILDIVLDTINKKTGGATKYINQRDEDFLTSAFTEENYRKEFTNALASFVAMGPLKYPVYTNKIYLSIFKEKAHEYRKILRLSRNEPIRDTFYAEVLDVISAYEYGFAEILKKQYNKLKRKLTVHETDELFSEFESQPHWVPLINKARQKMASRDLAFRDVIHLQLEEYIFPVQREDFERFLGEKSKEFIERLEETKDVMKRLKERG